MKNCLYCNSDYLEVLEDESPYFYVSCENCYHCGPLCGSEEDAINVWNDPSLFNTPAIQNKIIEVSNVDGPDKE